jgi:hypothetical protein
VIIFFKLRVFLFIERVHEIGILFLLIFLFALEVFEQSFIFARLVVRFVVDPLRNLVVLIFVVVEGPFSLVVE